MANDKRFIVKNGLSGPTVRFANGSNTTAVLDFNYGTDGTLNVVGNTNSGTLITINDRGLLGTAAVLTVNGDIAFGTSGITVNSTFYEASANNASFAYGKQEAQLSVANAVFATTANNALRFNGKQEAQLSVANAVYAVSANAALFANGASFLNGKQEAQLSVANAVFATDANNALRLNGKQESQLYVANAVYATLAGGVAGSFVANSDFAQTANNALYLGGNLPAYYTNATNITTGTLAEARLPFRMNQNVRTTDDVTFANGTFIGSVSIGGDLILTGNLVSTNIQSLSVSDPLIKLGANNASDVLWGGFTIHYSGSGNTTNHAGLVRSPSTKEFILMSTFGDEVAIANNNTININDSSFSYANLQVNFLRIGNNTNTATLSVTNYTGTSNNATFAYGKQESQLSVAIAANATFATTANNALRFNGKQEAQLSVANAVFADTANNALRFNGKQEAQLSVANAVFADTANNALRLNGKQEAQLSVAVAANSAALQGATWQSPLGIGTVTANTGAFTTLNVSGVATFTSNVVITDALIANSSAGTPGQVLVSNGTSIYWTNANNISGTVATANNATFAYGKQEGQLSVANAVFATTANNALFAYGKQESQLSVANAVFATTSANTLALQGATWQAPLGIGTVTANTGAFTNVTFAVANATNYISVRNIAHLSGDSNTTTAVAQVQIASFSANTYGSAKIYVQATETATTRRHVTELLVVHDNSTAIATEYGMLFTGPTALATYEVDIVSNNVRVLATPASANTIAFRVSEQLFTI
jgi:hypothetical protein